MVIFTQIELYPNVLTHVDIYRYYEGEELGYAFHVYTPRKEKLKGIYARDYKIEFYIKNEYVGTYFLKANGLEIAIEKLKNNGAEIFLYDGGSHKDFKLIKFI